MKTNRKRNAIVRRQAHRLARREQPTLAEAIEKVLIGGDLAPLSVEQRLDYYKKVCLSLGLNPLTRPFDYIAFKESEGAPAKMTLYARRDCTDQLRKIHGISVIDVTRTIEDGMIIAEAKVRDRDGKTDSAIGVISLTFWNKWAKPSAQFEELSGRELANARMKAETKAKRRATLSICGLGFLDMSELDTVDYNEVTPGGRIIEEVKPDPAQEVAKEKLQAHKEGKPIESHPEEPVKETIAITPWKEGRYALSGNGLPIVKAEIDPTELLSLGLLHNVQEKVTHMPVANVYKFIDRAAKCNVVATIRDSAGAP